MSSQALAEAVHAKQSPHEQALAEERKKKNYREFWAVISLKDPFRLVLSEMRDRLFHTREILHHCLVHPKCALPPPPSSHPLACPCEACLHRFTWHAGAWSGQQHVSAPILDLKRDGRGMRIQIQRVIKSPLKEVDRSTDAPHQH